MSENIAVRKSATLCIIILMNSDDENIVTIPFPSGATRCLQ